MSEHEALAKATRYDEIAAAIEADPEWFADDRIDDGEIVDALRMAASTLRDNTAKVPAPRTCYHNVPLSETCDRCAESYGDARPSHL